MSGKPVMGKTAASRLSPVNGMSSILLLFGRPGRFHAAMANCNPHVRVNEDRDLHQRTTRFSFKRDTNPTKRSWFDLMRGDVPGKASNLHMAHRCRLSHSSKSPRVLAGSDG